MIIWSLTDEPNEYVAKSGEIEIGMIRKSLSGRWRWEIVSLPGLFRFRDEAHGWELTEDDARNSVHRLWNIWLTKAGLVS